MSTTPHQYESRAARILDTIEREAICPRSRYFFLCYNSVLWLAWVGSIALGAISIAVINTGVMHGMYGLFEATHDSWLGLTLVLVPYVWIPVFVLLVVMAQVNLRHTSTGYRYPVWQVVGSSVVLSIFFGIVLYWLGLGHAVDRMVGATMPMYPSQERIEEKLWQQPSAGRLVGMYEGERISDTVVRFMDATGATWQLETADLAASDLAILETGERVRVLGVLKPEQFAHFHACGVFPWLVGLPMPLAALNEEREAFLERVYEHRRVAIERLATLEAETYGQNGEKPPMGDCAETAAAKRIEVMYQTP